MPDPLTDVPEYSEIDSGQESWDGLLNDFIAEFQQPVRLPYYHVIGDLPAATTNRYRMCLFNDSGTIKLAISNGTTWDLYSPDP